MLRLTIYFSNGFVPSRFIPNKHPPHTHRMGSDLLIHRPPACQVIGCDGLGVLPGWKWSDALIDWRFWRVGDVDNPPDPPQRSILLFTVDFLHGLFPMETWAAQRRVRCSSCTARLRPPPHSHYCACQRLQFPTLLACFVGENQLDSYMV